MIRVDKPAQAPAALDAGGQITANDCADFDLHAAEYRSGVKKFAFKKSVYGASRVKDALKRHQHDKCCFCESRFDANYKGDVEHFRPKGAVQTQERKLLPGYYWLAYSWTNLYYACADCNQYRKRSQFPLYVEATRAMDHHHPIDRELPLLIDPGGQSDPREHISFKKDVPVWQSEYGKVTIKTLELDREALNLKRRTHLEALDSLLKIVELLKDDARPDAIAAVHDARDRLAAAIRPQAAFSAASQDYLASRHS
jgi:uncharacterized protein (TIGR02646 family)